MNVLTARAKILLATAKDTQKMVKNRDTYVKAVREDLLRKRTFSDTKATEK